MEGRPLVRYLQQPYWQATGFLAGDIKVFVVRYRRKYYTTNRLSLSATEVRALYRKRQEVEEVIRVVKSQVSLEGCQAGYQRAFATSPRPGEGAQEHHIALCGARASRLRGPMAPTQATAHPPRTTGPRACSGARQKGRVRSAHGKIFDRWSRPIHDLTLSTLPPRKGSSWLSAHACLHRRSYSALPAWLLA